MRALTTDSPAQIYKADSQWSDQVLRTRQKLAGICGQCMNRAVRVQTLDGHIYEGIVIGSNNSYLHIMTRNARFLGPSNAILTLVLYELLVITLL
jgi:hypothetical protein